MTEAYYLISLINWAREWNGETKRFKGYMKLSLKRVGIQKSLKLCILMYVTFCWQYYGHEKHEFGSPKRLCLAHGEIDLVTLVTRN